MSATTQATNKRKSVSSGDIIPKIIWEALFSGRSWDFPEIPGNPEKSQEIRDFLGFPGFPRSEHFLAKKSLKIVSGEVIFWPETASRYRKVLRNRKKWHFRIRAPIDHFLRGKCDKCPPRVRRVKSRIPKKRGAFFARIEPNFDESAQEAAFLAQKLKPPPGDAISASPSGILSTFFRRFSSIFGQIRHFWAKSVTFGLSRPGFRA